MAKAPNQLERQDAFASTLAHELKGPLGPILNGLHLIRRHGTDSPDGRSACAVVERQARRLNDLLDGMLELYRAEQGKTRLHVEPVDLGEVVRAATETVDPLIRDRNHRLSVQVFATARSIRADAGRLKQVLTNLLTNAAKYTEPGGRIRLTAEREGDKVVIRVQDSGIGMPPELLPRVFDRFVQAEPMRGGLGIGLALVRRLVELHGGSVSAQSDGLGHGSEFVVRLPAEP